ncbi:tRNA (adenosine(37)-N6)-dimethylallyltransferase MiaA [Candidatus Gottesmanbacteria bacterium]|nr:tRNA (adenosine(37)-N6)-dimethylallyltransferase MiaA [Candidatus Gottesmanbacteria bacterium]
MKKVLIICGPTATGKTKTALALAKRFDGELVSADSRHVYRELTILTGKDLPADGTKIWATDVTSITEPYSVSQYRTLARTCIDAIASRSKLPILVGGTGLYIRSVIAAIDTASVPRSPELRKELEARSISQLQGTLQALDQPKWEKMNASDRMNPRRLVRAIEVATWHPKHGLSQDQTPQFDVLWIGLKASPEELLKNIARRVRERFDQGVVREVNAARNSLSAPYLPAATSLGFVSVCRFADGEIDKDQAVEQWTAQEYRYAKRQMTWFNKEKNIHWFDIAGKNHQTEIEALVRAWYT